MSNPSIPAARGISGEGWAAIAGTAGSAILLAKKLLTHKPAKPEQISRAEFYAELMVLKDNMHKDHLVLLQKLEANHLAPLNKLDLNQRALLAELERQSTRCHSLESAFARLDERTR